MVPIRSIIFSGEKGAAVLKNTTVRWSIMKAVIEAVCIKNVLRSGVRWNRLSPFFSRIYQRAMLQSCMIGRAAGHSMRLVDQRKRKQCIRIRRTFIPRPAKRIIAR